MITSIFFQIEHDDERQTCAFVISDSTETLDQFASLMLKGHRGLQDWVLSRKPLLVIPVWENDKTGGVLRDLSLISPTKIPKSCLLYTSPSPRDS